jgi:hypothetical protein
MRCWHSFPHLRFYSQVQMLCQCRNPLTVPTTASTQDVVSICTAISRPVQESVRVAIFAMLAGYLRPMSFTELARIALASIGG